MNTLIEVLSIALLVINVLCLYLFPNVKIKKLADRPNLGSQFVLLYTVFAIVMIIAGFSLAFFVPTLFNTNDWNSLIICYILLGLICITFFHFNYKNKLFQLEKMKKVSQS